MSKRLSCKKNDAARPRGRPFGVVLRFGLLVAAAYGMALPARPLPAAGAAAVRSVTRDAAAETPSAARSLLAMRPSPNTPVLPGGLGSVEEAYVESGSLILLGFGLIGAGTLLGRMLTRAAGPARRDQAPERAVSTLSDWRSRPRCRPTAQPLHKEEAVS
jgi:hypothetical protein